MFFLSKKWSGIGALKFGWKAFPLNLTDVNFRCSLKYVLSCETVYGIQPNRVSVYYKPVFKLLKDWPLYPYTDKHMHTDTYIHTIHTQYICCGTAWVGSNVSALFPICAVFIVVHIFTEANQFLPMWRFYQVKASKLKWNHLLYRSFFSANIMQLIFYSCTFLNFAWCFSVWR